MLSRQLQIIMICVFVVLLIWLVQQVRQRRLEVRYTLSWLFLAIALLLLSVFPSLLQVFARMLGIYSPVNMIFFSGFIFSLFIIYTLTAAISKMSDENKKMAQKIAILEDRLNECEKKQ